MSLISIFGSELQNSNFCIQLMKDAIKDNDLILLEYYYNNGASLLSTAAQQYLEYDFENLTIDFAKDMVGRVLMSEAAKHGHFEIVKFLCEKGVSPNQNDDIEWFFLYESPIEMAFEYGHLDIVMYLRNQGVDILDERYSTNLFISACRNEWFGIIRYMIEELGPSFDPFCVCPSNFLTAIEYIKSLDSITRE